MHPRTQIAGHAVHPLLVVFPLSLLMMSVILDIVGAVTGQPIWGTIACWNIVLGVASGFLASIFGLIDLAEIPAKTRAASMGIVHAILSMVVLGLFAISLVLRALELSPLPSPAALILSVAGLGLAGLSSWIGSELVEHMGVSVIDTDRLLSRSLHRSDRF